MKVLVVNAGSSSIKFQLLDMSNEHVIAKGTIEKIGLADSFIRYKQSKGQEIQKQISMPDHTVAAGVMLQFLTDKEIGVIASLSEISAVGHRIVHGGKLVNSCLATKEAVEYLKSIKDLSPVHSAANVGGILACKKVMPNVPHVLVFDTAFHSSIPKYAHMYAVPYEDYENLGIRKYGFHGTSHRYVTMQTAKYLNKPIKDLKLITVHLGNGSSICAVKNGKSVDTSMGFTPLEGLIMGTRSGDIDPTVVSYLCSKKGMTAAEAIDYLNKKSGLLGVSGISSDMRDLNASIAEGNERAKLALNMLAYRIKKYIGSYLAVLGGADAIVFTGGIGENQEDLREMVCSGMEYAGIKIDVDKNYKLPRGTEEDITGEGSKIKILRIPTDEELLIARDTLEIAKKA